MKNLLVGTFMLLCFNSIAQNDIVTLKSGQVLNCDIIQKYDTSILIGINQTTIEYSLGNIESFKMNGFNYNGNSEYNKGLAERKTKMSEWGQTETRKIYCEIVATGRLMSPDVTIKVDYGQKIDPWRNIYIDKVRTETGEVAKFNSVVDALNYMASQGWELLDAYPITAGTGGTVLHFFMYKTLVLKK